jgi:hypothetical protein
MDYIGFLEKEWPVITGAPILVAAAVLAITCTIALLMWILFNFGYRRQIDGLKDQLAAKGEWLGFAQDKAQAAKQRSKELESVMEKLQAQLEAKASINDITATASSAKTMVDQLLSANSALSAYLHPPGEQEAAFFETVLKAAREHPPDKPR